MATKHGLFIQCADSPDLSVPGGHYSHVCVAAGLVHISGQLPIDKTGVPLADRPFPEQAAQVLANLDACLKTGGASRDSLVQVRVYVTDIDQWPVFNRIYAEWIGAHKPARAVAGVSSLHYGAMLEIEAVALQSA